MKVTTMRGKALDMTAMMAQNAHVKALGNANMNARGDILGSNGQVVKKREQIAMEYHETSPAAVKSVGLAALASEMFMTPAEAVASVREANKKVAVENAAHIAKGAKAPLNPSQSSPSAPIKAKRKLIIEDDDAADL